MDRHGDRRRLLVGLGITGAAAMAHLARARPLQAATDVGPTGKSLKQIYDKIARTDQGFAEARTPITSLSGTPTAQYLIDQPGVYYMTGHITGVAGKSAIVVAASDVEIECDGFTFFGAPNTLACIRSSGSQRCIAIYDAGFTNWQHTSIDLSSAAESLVQYCWFNLCDSTGDPTGRGTCALGPGGVVYDCDVRGCHGAMVSVGPNGIIEETSNIDGTNGCFFSVGPAVMEDNFAMNNAGTGITILSKGVVIDNRLIAVGGITVGTGSTVSENDVDVNGVTVAIVVDGTDCTVEENYVVGNNGCTGIEVRAGSSRTVVDSNKLHGVDPAIVVAGADHCHVVCNSANGGSSGTSPYLIAGGNSFGPIVDVTGAGDIGGIPAAAHPWANFIH